MEPFWRRAGAKGWAIDVIGPRLKVRGRRLCVAAEVDGSRIWFDSRDADLAPAAEAFGAALLVASLQAGRPLHLHAPACATWVDQLTELTRDFRSRWYPDAPGAHVAPTVDGRPRATATALCFSGGVDGFHTLVNNGGAVDSLVYVVGYDVKLRQRLRAAAVERLVRDVAAETGTRAVVIRTNLRRHPLHRATPWLRAFGGALAAIGHLLSNEAGRLLVSSDGLSHEDPNAGSRAGTDWLHGSRRLAIEHVAGGTTRLEKIREIASEPLVRRHLRVCWKNVRGKLNCGRCEKCVRTMLALDTCGVLDRFAGFDRGRGLLAAIEALPDVDSVVAPFFRDMLAAGLPSGAVRAVQRLLARSAPTAHPGGQATGAVLQAPPRSTSRRRLLQADAFAPVFEPLVGNRVGYVRPQGNVGDDLIELAMVQLLAEYGIRWSLCDPAAPADFDLLIFGGGGNMGTRYMNNYDLRGRILALGPPLTILPQSFATREDRPFHRVYVRELQSLRLHPAGILAPDLALGLAWPEAAQPRRDLGIYLRGDRERVGIKPLLARDPVRLCPTPGKYLALAADHRRIITDRLHFAIAGLHAGREVTLVANNYHKNLSMHTAWLAGLGCRFANSVREAVSRTRRAA